jgi:hypothetical protein
MGLVVFLGVPPFILTPKEAKQIFNNGMPIDAIANILLLLAFFCAAVAYFYWTFVALRQRKIGAVFVIFLFNWVALAAFLFPLTTSDGMLLFIQMPTNMLNLGLVFVLSAVLTVLWFTKHSNTVLLSMTAFILVATLPKIPAMFSNFSNNQTGSEILLSETKKNVIAISLDGLPGHVVKDILEQDEDLKRKFKDFVFFENVAASSPATLISQMGIIHGNHDFSNWTNEQAVDWRDLYFNDAEKYDLYTGYTYNDYNQNGTEFSVAQRGPASQFAGIVHMYRSVALRLSSNIGTALFEKIQIWYFKDTLFQFSPSVDTYDDIINIFKSGNDKIGVVYMHFGFTHFPIAIDENCVIRGSDEEWLQKNQNEKGIQKSTFCALRKYAELIDKLKAEGVYDNSLIILNSDHGKPSKYYNAEPYNFRLNENVIWGFDRYLPLLMIKDAQVESDEITYSDQIVILDDLAQTTCYAVENSEACEDTPGVNLLDPTDTPPSEYYIHVARDADSTFKVETQKAVALSREIRLEEAMLESDEINLSTQKSSLSKSIQSSE